MLFGENQAAVTPEKAIINAAIRIVFRILSWVIGQGIQRVPESSLQYANVNVLLLAKKRKTTAPAKRKATVTTSKQGISLANKMGK
ncbi:hypothetical protein Dimus_021461 [Dionaea muscipula]